MARHPGHGRQIGASASLIEPLSSAELSADVEAAAAAEATVVVTVGSAADAAVQAAAAAHRRPSSWRWAWWFPDASPANVHGLAFDEAEAGISAAT